MQRDKYVCQECKRNNKFSLATTVHHKKHLKEHPELGLIDENLESVCTACHNTLHPEKQGCLERVTASPCGVRILKQ